MKKFLIFVTAILLVFCAYFAIKKDYVERNYNTSIVIKYSGKNINDEKIPETVVETKKFIIKDTQTFYESTKETEAYANSTLHTSSKQFRKPLFEILERRDDVVVIKLYSDGYFKTDNMKIVEAGEIEIPYGETFVVRTTFRSVQGLFYEYELTFKK